jgi:hypothetical protein
MIHLLMLLFIMITLIVMKKYDTTFIKINEIRKPYIFVDDDLCVYES